MHRRDFIKTSAAAIAASTIGPSAQALVPNPRMNILFITVDDMDGSIPGFMGNKHNLTPNLDAFAARSHRFVHNRTTAAICQPSREAMMTGLLPHHSGGLGFDPIYDGTPTLVSTLKAAGYFVGVAHKVSHMSPPSCFPWDYIRSDNDRRPTEYAGAVTEAIGQADKAGKPFYVNCNINDPHRPFYGSAEVHGGELGETDGYAIPNPLRPEEVEIPPFLEDIPLIRKEVAQYWSSCRRMDRSIGAVLEALEKSGHADNTLVMFSADHGMPFPFAKCTTYTHGTHTPAVLNYPGMGTARVFDERTCNIDYMPTMLEILGVKPSKNMDGHSWVPLMHGNDSTDREFLVTHINGNSSGQNFPCRAIQDDRYSLMFMAWSDGKRRLITESMKGLTYPALQAYAASNPAARARLNEYDIGTPLALYDFVADPGQRTNLLKDPKQHERVERMKTKLHEYMVRTQDPQLANFDAYLAGKSMTVEIKDPRHQKKGEE